MSSATAAAAAADTDAAAAAALASEKPPVQICKGINGLDKVVLRDLRGSSVEIYLYGAHVTSWKNEHREELLFVSSKAIFKPPKAIRGGIPICFPQFSNLGPLEAHGFARNRFWSIDPSPPPFPVNSSNKTYVDLLLKPTEDDMKIWPHSFEFRLRVTLGPAGDLMLTSRIRNTNPDGKPFTFTFAYHTYFSFFNIRWLTAISGGIRALSMMATHGWRFNHLIKVEILCLSCVKPCGVVAMLESCPFTQELIVKCYVPEEVEETVKYGPITRDDLNCDLMHLKTVKFEEYFEEGNSGEPMLTVAKILLRRAPNLEKMVIYKTDDDPISMKELDDLKNTLLQFPRSSHKATIEIIQRPW